MVDVTDEKGWRDVYLARFIASPSQLSLYRAAGLFCLRTIAVAIGGPLHQY
jgi:hypothetical protein